jgi:hypothetical protein
MPLSPRTLRPSSSFNPRSISGLAIWLDASDASSLYTTDAGAVTAASSPTEISGCVLWLDGADNATITASGGLVSQWTDKSATGAVLTASGSARPTLSSTGFNSRQALVFNGTSTNMASSSAFTATNGLSGMTRIAVCAHTTNTVGALARVYDGGSDSFLFMNGSARAYVSNGGNFVSYNPNGSTSILSAGLYADTYSASALSFYSSGAGVSGTVTGTIPATTGSGSPTLHVGSNIGANSFWNGPVAEIVYFNRALTRAELARVEAYLAAKWGISGVHAPATATNDPVGAWLDKSGNGRHLTQATSAARPSLLPTGISSKPCLNFDGTDDNIWRQPGLTSDDLSILIVHQTNFMSGGVTYEFTHSGDTTNAQATNLTGFGNVAGLQVSANGTPTYMCDVVRAFTQIDTQGRSGSAGDITANVPALGTHCVSFSAIASAIRKQAWNNGRGMQGTARFNCGGWSAVTLGCRRNNLNAGQVAAGSVFLSGRIAEVLAYSRYLPDAERRRLELYLARKWNITLAGAPTVANADAQDWIDRAYGNGGTVSATTAAAVNDFCTAIDAAALRDRFYRLNLFAGTGLNACLVPLYVGPTSRGIKYGGATDTNWGPFVSGDYVETGASGGLTGNGTSKYLTTGLTPANLPDFSTGHLSVYSANAFGGSTIYALLSSLGAGYAENYAIEANRAAGGLYGAWGKGGTFSTLATQAQGAGNGHTLIARTSSTDLSAYRNTSGTAIATSSTSVTPATSSSQWAVFAHGTGGSPLNYAAARLGGYSIGASMTGSQAAAFYTAMQAFQTAMGRNV